PLRSSRRRSSQSFSASQRQPLRIAGLPLVALLMPVEWALLPPSFTFPVGCHFGGSCRQREAPIFSRTDLVPAAKLLVVVFTSHWLFANQAARAVEARMTTRGAEYVVFVLDRHGKLALAMRVAAAMANSALSQSKFSLASSPRHNS